MKSSTKSHLISILMILFLTTGIISSCKTDDESDKTEETTNTSRFTISSISGNTGEDGTTATFTMNLKTEPNGDVVIDVVSSDTGEGTVSPASLTFTAADYNIDQTADVSGVDDLVADSNQDYTIQLSINSANTTDTTGYASLDPDDVSVTNIDNDTAGFTILSISGSTAEDGTTATFTVRLNTQPVGDVVIDVVSSDTGEGTVSPPSLTFTTSTWNDDQTVTVTGISDATDDGDQSYSIQLTINSETTLDTTGYAGLNPNDVNVVNLNNNFKLPDTGQTTSFTSTFGEDSDYLINPPSLIDNSDDTITDNNTGRMWQKEDDNTTDTWTEADSYCSSLSLGSQTDWRLPYPKELLSIVDYEVATAPTINSSFFPNTNPTVYWTSATSMSDTNQSLYVTFAYGQLWNSYRNNPWYVRCVRSGSDSDVWPLNFMDNSDDTVGHPSTRLTWQKEDDNITKTWEEALTYCEGLPLAGYSNWRLPNATELQSIVDYSVANPAIDSSVFPNANSSGYWSSTTVGVATGNAVNVNFGTGFVAIGSGKTTKFYVRCVRGGQ